MLFVDSPPLKRYSLSPSPHEVLKSGSRPRSRPRSRSRSWSRPKDFRARSRSQGRSEQVNPGNTLYVSGLSTRVSERELDEHFSKEGKVSSCFLVVEPRTRISRGFAFITMGTMDEADRCVKFLNQSVLDGRSITVEKSRRKRGRTPTPGRYLGSNHSKDYGGYGRNRGRRDDYGYRRRSPRRSSYHVGRNCDHSPRRSPYQDGGGRRRDYSSPSWSPPYKNPGAYSPKLLPMNKSGGYSPRQSSPPPPPPYEGGGGSSRRRLPSPPYVGEGYSLRRSPRYEGGRDYTPRGSSYDDGVRNYSPRKMNGEDRDYFPRPNDDWHYSSPTYSPSRGYGYAPWPSNGGGGPGYSPRPSNGGRSRIRFRSKSPPYGR